MQSLAAIDFNGLDKLLEHRSRLLICILLADGSILNFKTLRQTLEETDGNLGAQLRKLEAAGYIKVKKTFENRRPVSRYSLSRRGVNALAQHLETINRLREGVIANI